MKQLILLLFVISFSITLIAQNGSQILSTKNQYKVTGLIDPTPPEVTVNSTPSYGPINTDFKVTVNCVDPETGIDKAFIRYRPVNGAMPNTFTSVRMTNITGNTFQGTIPAHSVTELGVEYKIQITNQAGLWNTDSLKIYSSGVSFPPSLDITNYPSSVAGASPSNYRIISIPLVLANNTVSGVFSEILGPYNNTKWRMFKYNGSIFDELNDSSALVPGQGYWFIARSFSGSLTTGAGLSVDVNTTRPFKILLTPGWNQIGNPYNFAISWADILNANGTNAGNLNSNKNIITYNGTVVSGTQKLRKFEGGFIKLTSDTAIHLIIPVSKNAGIQSGRVASQLPELKNAIDQPDWEIPLLLQVGDQVNSLGGVGMHPDACLSFDHYDDFTLPRFFNYAEVNFGKKFQNMTYTKDIVPTRENFAWTFTVKSNVGAPQATLRWDNSYFGTNKEIYLVDMENYQLINMGSVNNYTFSNSSSHEFKVIYGNSDYIKKELTPADPVLLSPYPNPATDVVSIPILLPEIATVQAGVIKIVNDMGEEISSASTPLEPGHVQLSWDSSGQAPGIYFVNLHFGHYTLTKKIIKP